MKEQTPNLSRGLDYYKMTMGQVIHDRHPNAEVTFTFKNRNAQQPLSEYVAPETLQSRLDAIREQGFTPEEIAYYAGLTAQNGDARFTTDYLDYLADLRLPDVSIVKNPETGDLDIDSRGKWIDVTFWETVIMSEINEIYYAQLMESHGLALQDLYDEGDKRLDEKIALLKNRPDIKFADFGTRRRFSADWQEQVVSRLVSELPDNLTGTSNPWFAHKYGLKPIGTFAHEMPMVYAGIADAEGKDPLDGQGNMLRDWDDSFDGDLSIALSDTYGSEFFFNDFTPEQARKWQGLRHDSGDPIEFAERAIAFYKSHDIDPTTKTIVFSDGLNVDKIVELADRFVGRVNVLFGWGTTLMNDLGLPANNMVMKATQVTVPIIENDGSRTYVSDPEYDDEAVEYATVDLVKLSDDEGKHTGPQKVVDRYVDATERRNGLAKTATNRLVTVA